MEVKYTGKHVKTFICGKRNQTEKRTITIPGNKIKIKVKNAFEGRLIFTAFTRECTFAAAVK